MIRNPRRKYDPLTRCVEAVGIQIDKDIMAMIKKHKGSKGNKPGKKSKTKMKRSVDKSKEGVRWKNVQ